MSLGQFRQFVEGRPEKERWELIDGVAMMMTPPTLAHQRIASNLERLLLDTLESHAPSLTAFQAIGVNLGPTVDDYDPEPDVVVTDLDTAETLDERYADRFYSQPRSCHRAIESMWRASARLTSCTARAPAS